MASIAAHLVLVVVLPSAHDVPPHAVRPRTLVTIETVLSLPTPPPPVHVDALAATEAAPRTARPVAARRAVARVAPAEQLPTPEVPVDLSGVTLSNEGSSWSSPVGNGEAMTGPVIVTAPAGPAPVTHGSEARGDRVVGVGDLSRPPKAPNLDGALAANYPADARRAGITGKAVVRARILATGSVGPIRVVSETVSGFGNACRRTLAGSHWQAPLDAHSEPVTTDINYTCTFVAR
ncbi:MAG TPA: energy transducer TonB [Kofleriaceae bacterium]